MSDHEQFNEPYRDGDGSGGQMKSGCLFSLGHIAQQKDYAPENQIGEYDTSECMVKRFRSH
jgi:hypothetical protein